ncbi:MULTISPECIES: type II toxin-antitoxin system RelE/ParE family toxin [Leptolyngbya]|uniref:type II toxin-antitoxin system RelE/ParE family toxin n=1 Tax=Leptolyngbya TaxID=47251 RepID=UPI001689FA28|nr:type II toxin-antitoxin system RelE/ParE family toxin [Leptolyngbya sp. FACHB-1624]MBD1856985.1 type II toxin-antitoxin system RelE/ParE family toxin [Leptolyngbya sp. FACHB-1624]
MSRRYQITAPANQDLEEILRQIAETSGFDLADQFLSRFTQKLRNIASFPNLGKPRKEWGEDYRSLIQNNYRVTDEVVEIFRVVSGYRDLDTLFNEDQDNPP